MAEPTTETSPRNTHAESSQLCQVCRRNSEVQVPLAELNKELQSLVQTNAVTSETIARICPRCLALFNRAQEQLKSQAEIYGEGDQALPTPLRLDADERYTGRGVTIAFLDSGFYAHSDLLEPVNRILAYHSIFASEDDPTRLHTPDVASWHGMMTSVVAAGNGYLSNGLYRGIAPEADLVLVKIGKTGRIPEMNIQAGLEWVLRNRSRFNIRVVNISAGGDFE